MPNQAQGSPGKAAISGMCACWVAQRQCTGTTVTFCVKVSWVVQRQWTWSNAPSPPPPPSPLRSLHPTPPTHLSTNSPTHHIYLLTCTYLILTNKHFGVLLSSVSKRTKCCRVVFAHIHPCICFWAPSSMFSEFMLYIPFAHIGGSVFALCDSANSPRAH